MNTLSIRLPNTLGINEQNLVAPTPMKYVLVSIDGKEYEKVLWNKVTFIKGTDEYSTVDVILKLALADVIEERGEKDT